MSTIVAVAVAGNKLLTTFIAAQNMRRAGVFDGVVIFNTLVRFKFKLFGIDFIPLKRKLDWKDYNKFVLRELVHWMGLYNEQFTHACIFQYDGFVKNPSQFLNEFLDYDYIGAPFPIAPPKLEHFLREDDTQVDVGNGGFSLRSKNLLLAVSELANELPENNAFINEDGIICKIMYRSLMARGMVFADRSLAARFSVEDFETELEYGEVSFGFHGKSILKRRYPIRFFLQWIGF